MGETQIESAGVQSPPFSETQLEQALADDRLVKGLAPSPETVEKDAQPAEPEVRTKVHLAPGPEKAGADTVSPVTQPEATAEQQAELANMVRQMTTMQVKMAQRKRREFLAELMCGQLVELANVLLVKASGVLGNDKSSPKDAKMAFKDLRDIDVFMSIALKAQQLMRPGNQFAEEVPQIRLAQPVAKA